MAQSSTSGCERLVDLCRLLFACNVCSSGGKTQGRRIGRSAYDCKQHADFLYPHQVHGRVGWRVERPDPNTF